MKSATFKLRSRGAEASKRFSLTYKNVHQLFENLKEKLKSLGEKRTSLYWIDDENDVILLKTVEDLREALHLAKSSAIRLLSGDVLKALTEDERDVSRRVDVRKRGEAEDVALLPLLLLLPRRRLRGAARVALLAKFRGKVFRLRRRSVRSVCRHRRLFRNAIIEIITAAGDIANLTVMEAMDIIIITVTITEDTDIMDTTVMGMENIVIITAIMDTAVMDIEDMVVTVVLDITAITVIMEDMEDMGIMAVTDVEDTAATITTTTISRLFPWNN
ncbi:unnamed protein product [Caenorhabditis auriculariae]|uniref:PB1 domain-containing protein n=1 Tax=Caenorhabditis auriculariae TaxID=2777116 RepID=A0A8S1HH83_9PELO|nr:unnamed protein product [Caenorhabditis auriculariae]